MTALVHTRNILRLPKTGYARPRLRRSKPVCPKCGDLRARVEGPTCLHCDLPFEADAPVRAETEARRAAPWL
jgi:hypothetical protein